MKLSEMKTRCHLCKYYRAMSYADGHVSIGCMKESKDGIWPVDIVNMKVCPRDHKKKRKIYVDQMELLHALGIIFAMCCPNPCYIPLHQLLKDCGATLKAKNHLVARALTDLKILLVVSRTEKGQRGIRVTYQWNLKIVGSPSLAMVDNINDHLAGLVVKEKIKANDAKAVRNPIEVRHLLVDKGTTACEMCWMRETPECRDRLAAMGLDCKVVNVNTLRYEEDSSVGLQEESKQ